MKKKHVILGQIGQTAIGNGLLATQQSIAVHGSQPQPQQPLQLQSQPQPQQISVPPQPLTLSSPTPSPVLRTHIPQSTTLGVPLKKDETKSDSNGINEISGKINPSIANTTTITTTGSSTMSRKLENGVSNSMLTTSSTVESTEEVHERELPKALVKPNVLTHVIEDFIIQESLEPFPVSKPSIFCDTKLKLTGDVENGYDMPPSKNFLKMDDYSGFCHQTVRNKNYLNNFLILILI